MNVISLFNGMGCGWLALDKAGIPVEKRYSSEIDKYAIKVNDSNYPDTIQLGDITKWREWDIDWGTIDLVLAGSPCQGFSFAGKGLNFNDERSKLFFVFVEILNHIKQFNPKVLFLLENVQMKYEHELVISRYVGCNPIVINSALLSAQNRVRNYWTNINQKPVGLFEDMEADIPQPKDKGILLKDILEPEVSEKYLLSKKMMEWLNKRERDATDINGKASCFTAGGHSGGLHSQMDLILQQNENTIVDFSHSRDEGLRFYEDKAPTLNARDYKEPRCVAMRGRGENNTQQLEINKTGKTNTLTSVQKDNLVMQINPSKESGGKQPYQQNRVYDTDGKNPALMSELSSGSNAILDKSPCLHGFEHGTNGQFNRQIGVGGMVRRLTEVECERLQTVPDNYTNHVSSTQRYKMLGNGWTVDVIAYIFGFIKAEIYNVQPKNDMQCGVGKK